MLIACHGCHLQYDVSGMKSGDHIRCHCGELLRVLEPTPHDARMLHCSNCGGKLAPGKGSCEYCGCEVTLADRHLGVACPECFARLLAGARFCRECGVEIKPHTVHATRLDADCPRCEGKLSCCRVDNETYTECSSCGGIWLDEGFFERVIEEKDAVVVKKMSPAPASSAAAGPAARSWQPPTAATGDVRYLKCPVCAQLMHRKNFARVSGVIIDWCKGCGFWFDAHELERIMKFVKAGGMDHSRARDIAAQERRLERLRQQQRKESKWGGKTTTLPQENSAFGGSFQDFAGFSIFDAVQEVVGSAFSKFLSR